MSGRRRGEQHCHMQVREKDKVVWAMYKRRVPLQYTLVGGVGRRPSAACEEDSPTMPIYRPVTLKGRAPIGSAGL